jgi:hypothetical protein
MFIEAIMLEARVLLMPPASSAHRLLHLARDENCQLDSWASRVKALRLKLGGLPDLMSWASGNGALENIDEGVDSNVRKTLLAGYRCEVVYPAADKYDQDALNRAMASNDWPYDSFGASAMLSDRQLLRARWDSTTWLSFRIWATARCTGRLPLPLLGFDFFPQVIATCPLCQAAEADLEHVVATCPFTRDLRHRYSVPDATWTTLRLWLSDGSTVVTEEGCLCNHVTFLASVVGAVGGALRPSLGDATELLEHIAGTQH